MVFLKPRSGVGLTINPDHGHDPRAAACFEANRALHASGGPMREFLVQRDVPVPMRDGVVLRADVDRPSGHGQHPVWLQRTAYGKGGVTTGPMINILRAIDEGFAIVV